jgi:hypothetical protein
MVEALVVYGDEPVPVGGEQVLACGLGQMEFHKPLIC